MNKPFTLNRPGFSLIELVVVVVIIGILAAVAIPRMSRGASAASEASLTSSLNTLRSSLDVYFTEHGDTYPSLANLSAAMTGYSDITGATLSATKVPATGVIYGPYLRSIPALPVGASKGKTAFVATLGGDGGWVYDAATGVIKANCPDTELDGKNVKYNTY